MADPNNDASRNVDDQSSGDLDLHSQIAALTDRVNDMEEMLSACTQWLAALSGDILKSQEFFALSLSKKDPERRRKLIGEVFENYYRLNPEARPKDD